MKKESGKTRRLAVTMNKGGSTKTTTSLHLAAALAGQGKRVLLIDTDPQSREGNIAKHLGIKTGDLPASFNDFVIKGDKSAILEVRPNLFLMRGGHEINSLRRDIDNRQIGGHLVFSEALAPIEHLFDFVILDTPPSWDAININGLFYVDEIIIPINLENLTVDTLDDYLTINLKEIQKYRSHPLKWGYCLPTRYDRRVKQSDELLSQIARFFDSTLIADTELAEKYSNTILCQPIRYNVRISEASSHGQTVFEYAPESNGAKDYQEFARTVTGEAFKTAGSVSENA